MADEYTPTTRQVEGAYVSDSLGAGISEMEAGRRFSRWLAAHDAEVREQTAREIDDRAALASTIGVRYGLTIAAAIARSSK